MSRAQPSRLARWLVASSAPAEDRAEILGDLEEEWWRIRRDRSPRVAFAWYWIQSVRSVLPNLAQRRRRQRRQRLGRPKPEGAMRSFSFDLKYALRSIRKGWGFSLGVVVTLALGIGANTLVYSLVDSAILNPFPFPEPRRLVGVGSEWPRLSRGLGFFETLSPAEYRDVQQQTETLERVVMWDMGFRSVATGPERPEVLLTAFWFDDAFPTLGLQPSLGRGFTRDELDRGDAVALLSHRHWLSRLGGDPEALGRTIQVEGEPYTLIGVMPQGGQILGSDLWIPMGASPDVFSRRARRMEMLARIRPGYDLEQVNSELATIAGRIEQAYAGEFDEYRGWNLQALPWTEVNIRQVRPAAVALMGAVAFVLLIVCANIGSLLLARSAGRRREIAVRRALGAGRGRIVRQLLSESLLLALAGAAVGIGLTQFVVSAALQDLLARIPFVVIEVTINERVMLFTALVATVTGLIFGLVPALHATRSDPQASLKVENQSSIGSRSRQRLQRAFVAAQVMVALVLLVQAGLLANSFVRMQQVDPGFDTSNVLTMRMTLSRQRYPDGPSISAFFSELGQRVEALPGVRAVGFGGQYPPLTFGRSALAVEGQTYDSDEELPLSYFTRVTPGYHEALGIPLVRGRTFTPADTERSPLVVVINEAAARRYFPDTDPIGRRLKAGGQDQPWMQVVGVVRSVRNRGPEFDPEPEVFVSNDQRGRSNQLFLIVRAENNPRALLEPVQREVTALDPAQSVYAVQTVSEVFEAINAPRSLGTIAIVVLALFALALAASGIYSVVAMGVAERTREIGVRLALGATTTGVERLVVRQAMRPVVVGGVLGFLGALAAGQAMAQFLYGVTGMDPLTLGGVTGLLILIATTASYLPARRASRLDPTVALRNE